MKIPNSHYLIVDVEATCSDIGEVPREEMEIIEIGAVMQDARNFEIDSTFQTFVRPVRHPELTQFCTQLTSIKQFDVTSAPQFPTALESMRIWMQSFPDALFCSWGQYDQSQFQQDCEYHQSPYPFSTAHLNLKAAFSEAFGLRKKFGMSDAMRHVGLQLEGTHHRGLDDAKNMARIVRRVCIGE